MLAEVFHCLLYVARKVRTGDAYSRQVLLRLVAVVNWADFEVIQSLLLDPYPPSQRWNRERNSHKRERYRISRSKSHLGLADECERVSNAVRRRIDEMIYMMLRLFEVCQVADGVDDEVDRNYVEENVASSKIGYGDL